MAMVSFQLNEYTRVIMVSVQNALALPTSTRVVVMSDYFLLNKSESSSSHPRAIGFGHLTDKLLLDVIVANHELGDAGFL